MIRWLKRLLIALVIFLVVGWVGCRMVLRSCIAIPPKLPEDTSVLKLQPETRDGRTWLGKSCLYRRDGLMVLHLKGSPLEIGYAAGVLLQTNIHTLENEFIDMIHSYVPQDWKINLLKNYIIYRNRYLSSYIPDDYRMEILGYTLGCPDVHPEYGNYYNRVLNYHAAHDVSYMLIDNPLISRAGCTAFGAWGQATEGGHLVTGRNFDWEAAEVFSRDRLVVLCEPDGKIPFISLSWAGMAGVVSGMNREGVSVTVNGAPSDLPAETATPVAIVAREIMEKAHNLPEALDILRQAHVFVSTIWLVGSRVDGKFVVVEKTPETTQVREPNGDSIVCPNHFETPALRDGYVNTNYMAEATSVSRDTRMKELIREAQSKIDAIEAAKFLRDRNLPGGVFAGNENRATINAFIATHATVMDLTDGIFWAASPPHQLGKFVAFDVNDFDRELPDRTIAPDPVLASGEYERARKAHQKLLEGGRALRNRYNATALKCAEEAEALNPGYYQNAFLRGRALLESGRKADAAQAFEAALAEHPAFAAERKNLEAFLRLARTPN